MGRARELANLFDHLLKNNKFSEHEKNLLIFKKVLIDSNFENESNLLETIRPLLNSENLWKPHALLFLGDYFLSKGEEIKAIENVHFKIQRKIENGYILKDIRFTDGGKNHHYQEKVQALGLSELSHYLQKAGLNVVDLWGDYKLNDFDVLHSNRLIIVAQK